MFDCTVVIVVIIYVYIRNLKYLQTSSIPIHLKNTLQMDKCGMVFILEHCVVTLLLTLTCAILF